MIVCQTTLAGRTVSYTLCRVLPDTALMLRDVLREAARLWERQLGGEIRDELRQSSEGEAFFTGRVRLESVPPEREMVAVWLPLPPDFDAHVRPQLIDAIEAFDAAKGMRDPPEGWPGWPA